MTRERFRWIQNAIERSQLTQPELTILQDCELKFSDKKEIHHESFLEEVFKKALWRGWGQEYVSEDAA